MAVFRILIISWIVCASAARSFAQPFAFAVVVHPGNPVSELGKKQLEDIFLKKVRFWGHGGMILPADLSPMSPARSEFSREILQRPVSAVRSYWQYMIFSGREVQPPEFAQDEDMIEYVIRNPNAIGYVSRAADRSGVKTLAIGP